MNISELNYWNLLVQLIPEYSRPYLEFLSVAVIFFAGLNLILKIICGDNFKKFYDGTFLASLHIAGLARKTIKSAAKSLELPGSYPKLQRLGLTIFMINNYISATLFGLLTFALMVSLVFSNSQDYGFRIVGILLAIVGVFFGWFFFAEAERNRLSLAKNRPQKVDY